MKLIMCKGLPGSGKSTWAKELIDKNPEKYKRINKDDLRAMFDNSKWSKKNEDFILLIRDMFVTSALIKGFSVIVDDTNLSPKHESKLRELVDQYNSAIHLDHSHGESCEFEIKDFTDVSLDECIKRDQKRSNYVGEKVIRNMYKQFLAPKPVVTTQDPNLPKAILCDIDGTLALFGDANPYERNFLNDKVNSPVADILGRYNDMRIKIILVSGRKDIFKDQTEKWLKTNSIMYDELHMRQTAPAGENEPKDVIIKQKIYDEQIKGKYNVLFVLDDRDQVVEFWRSQGLTCLQVAEGDF